MNAVTKTEGGKVVPQEVLKPLPVQIKERESQFNAALPVHMPVERFMRVVLTAVQNNPKLASADRSSFFNACMKAAQDGLLPDGREGALVIYSTRTDGQWIDKVAWQPMIAGIRKKVRNSDTIATWDVQAVFARDQFDYELGDEPFIKHKPFMGGDPGPSIAFYSVAVLKSGEKSRDVMTRSQVEYVRDTFSKKDRDGKFSPAWRNSFEEMGKKTVAKRHSKVLPMSTDLDDLLRRDDELYDMSGKSDRVQAQPTQKLSLAERIDVLAGVKTGPEQDQVTHDPITGEIGDETDNETNENSSSGDESESSTSSVATDEVDQGAGKAANPSADPALTMSETTTANNEAKLDELTKAQIDALLVEGDDKASRGMDELRKFWTKLGGQKQKAVGGARQLAKWQATAKEADASEIGFDSVNSANAALIAEGDAVAAKGTAAFERWALNLSGDQEAALGAQIAAWRTVAAKVAA